jgi:hypothetical protein
MRAMPVALAAALALAACAPEAPDEQDRAERAPIAPAGGTDPVAVELAADATGSGIPRALQGRWGLVPADCEPGRADAKGLLVIEDDSLEFYESMAELRQVDERSAGRIRADFAFTGEGISWQREMELVTRDRGETMVRREFGAEAMPEPLEYARCT